MSEVLRDFEPVDGVVVPRSTTKTLGLIVLAILLFPFGCFLIWAKIKTEFFPGTGRYEITLFGLLFGIVAVLAGPIMTAPLRFPRRSNEP